MYKYTNAFTNRSGDSLAGYFARVFDSDGNQADLFADDSGTPIATVSGVANAALSDENGMFRWYIAGGTYDIRFYDANDVFVAPAEIGVPMIDATAITVDLSADTGATLVGTPTGTVQASLDARPTSAALAASGGAATVGTSAGVNAEQMFALSPLPLTAFASLQAAIEGASDQGRDLALRGTINLATAQAATLSGNLRIIMEAGTVIQYTGGAQIDRLVTITCAGYNLQIVGNASTFDGNNKANRPLAVYNQESSEPDCDVSGLTIQNARMIAGQGFNVGATGLNIQGSFNKVTVTGLNFIDITRAAGSGVSSSYGSCGLLILHSGGTQRARHVRISNITGDNVSTDDAAASVDRVDCDLMIINQGGLTNEGLGDSCKIDRVTANEVLGRGVKCITSCVPIINDVEFSLSQTGIVGAGSSSAVNCQLGVGIVTKVRSTLRGTALTAGSNHTAVSFFSSDTRTAAIGSMTVDDLLLDCNVSGAVRCEALVGVENSSATDTTRKIAVLSKLVVLGQPIGGIVSIGNNGTTKSGTPDPFLLDIDGFDGELTRCAIRSGGSPANMQASFRSVRNTGSTVDAVKRNDGAALGELFGVVADAGGNTGIAKHNGGVPLVPSISGPLLTPTDVGTSRMSGLTILLGRFLAASESVELPAGFVGSALLVMGANNSGAPGLFHTNSGNTITSVQAAAGITVGSSGTDPGGSQIAVWKSSSGTKLTVKNNSATSRYVLVMSFG